MRCPASELPSRTPWARQLSQFTFSPSLASRTAGRTAGSPSIFWKRRSKRRPFPEGGSRLRPARPRAPPRRAAGPALAPAGAPSRPAERRAPCPACGSARLPENLALVHLQEVTDPSLGVTNGSQSPSRSTGRGAARTLLPVGGAAGASDVAIAVPASSAC